MSKWLRITFIAAVIATAFFLAGAEADQYFSEHPSLTVASSVSNPDDAMVALHRCAKSASWNVTLKAHEPLTLELLTCPGDFHPKALGQPDDDGWPWPIQRQVLLLERRGPWRVKIVSALYSDLAFTRVEPGSIEGNDTDAVLWSYSIKCGSCHGGPEGVLVWDNATKDYDWNASWLKDKPQANALKAALPDGYYLDEANSLFWTEDRSALQLRAVVHTSEDAHCCPKGGNLYASIDMDHGTLRLSGIQYQPPFK